MACSKLKGVLSAQQHIVSKQQVAHPDVTHFQHLTKQLCVSWLYYIQYLIQFSSVKADWDKDTEVNWAITLS